MVWWPLYKFVGHHEEAVCCYLIIVECQGSGVAISCLRSPYDLVGAQCQACHGTPSREVISCLLTMFQDPNDLLCKTLDKLKLNNLAVHVHL